MKSKRRILIPRIKKYRKINADMRKEARLIKEARSNEEPREEASAFRFVANPPDYIEDAFGRSFVLRSSEDLDE